MEEELEAVLRAIHDALTLAGIEDARVVWARDAAGETAEVEGDPEVQIEVLGKIRDALAGIEDDWVVAARNAAIQAIEGDPEGAAMVLRGDVDERQAIQAIEGPEGEALGKIEYMRLELPGEEQPE
jgi:hypothetical protein